MKADMLTAIVLALTCLVSAVQSQVEEEPSSHRVADVLGSGYICGNKLTGERPQGYEDFLVLWVEFNKRAFSGDDPSNFEHRIRASLYPDSQGKIPVRGRVVFKATSLSGTDSDKKYVSFEFREAYLLDLKGKPVALVFDTREVNGVRYYFEGRYAGEDNSTEGAVHLEGRMTKLTNTGEHTETELRFVPYVLFE